MAELQEKDLQIYYMTWVEVKEWLKKTDVVNTSRRDFLGRFQAA